MLKTPQESVWRDPRASRETREEHANNRKKMGREGRVRAKDTRLPPELLLPVSTPPEM